MIHIVYWNNYKSSDRRKNYEEKTSIGRPRTRRKDVVEKDISMIHKNTQIKDANDRDRWNDIVMAAMGLLAP